jgi:hypothetical protein
MSAQMPPRLPGLQYVEIDKTANEVIVGKCVVPGLGLRIGLAFAGQFVHMSPAGARQMAPDWEKPIAVNNGLDWIATALRQAADELDGGLN